MFYTALKSNGKNNTTIQKYNIYAILTLEVPDSMAASNIINLRIKNCFFDL